jgi:uncharacterized membrane protein YgcG
MTSTASFHDQTIIWTPGLIMVILKTSVSCPSAPFNTDPQKMIKIRLTSLAALTSWILSTGNDHASVLPTLTQVPRFSGALAGEGPSEIDSAVPQELASKKKKGKKYKSGASKAGGSSKSGSGSKSSGGGGKEGPEGPEDSGGHDD